MALGVPTIATDIGTIHRIILHNENGLLIRDNNPELWKEAIRRLVSDAALRKSWGEKARGKIVSDYSIAANKETYLRILRG